MKSKIFLNKIFGIAIGACIVIAVTLFLEFEQRRNHWHERIESALNMILHIKPGMREGQIFEFLGFNKPVEEIDSFIEGRSGATWTRYDVGFGKEIVLECDSFNPRQGDIFNFDDGILLLVLLRKQKQGQPGEYENLNPQWKNKESLFDKTSK